MKNASVYEAIRSLYNVERKGVRGVVNNVERKGVRGVVNGTEPGPTNSNDGSEIKHTSPHRLMKNPLNNNLIPCKHFMKQST
jgi:hypothetical protein